MVTAVVPQVVVPVLVPVFMSNSCACNLFKRIGIALESKWFLYLLINTNKLLLNYL